MSGLDQLLFIIRHISSFPALIGLVALKTPDFDTRILQAGIIKSKNSTRYKFPEQMQEIWYLVLRFLVLIQFIMVSKRPTVVLKTIHKI